MELDPRNFTFKIGEIVYQAVGDCLELEGDAGREVIVEVLSSTAKVCS